MEQVATSEADVGFGSGPLGTLMNTSLDDIQSLKSIIEWAGFELHATSLTMSLMPTASINLHCVDHTIKEDILDDFKDEDLSQLGKTIVWALRRAIAIDTRLRTHKRSSFLVKNVVINASVPPSFEVAVCPADAAMQEAGGNVRAKDARPAPIESHKEIESHKAERDMSQAANSTPRSRDAKMKSNSQLQSEGGSLQQLPQEKSRDYESYKAPKPQERWEPVSTQQFQGDEKPAFRESSQLNKEQASGRDFRRDESESYKPSSGQPQEQVQASTPKQDFQKADQFDREPDKSSSQATGQEGQAASQDFDKEQSAVDKKNDAHEKGLLEQASDQLKAKAAGAWEQGKQMLWSSSKPQQQSEDVDKQPNEHQGQQQEFDKEHESVAEKKSDTHEKGLIEQASEQLKAKAAGAWEQGKQMLWSVGHKIEEKLESAIDRAQEVPDVPQTAEQREQAPEPDYNDESGAPAKASGGKQEPIRDRSASFNSKKKEGKVAVEESAGDREAIPENRPALLRAKTDERAAAPPRSSEDTRKGKNRKSSADNGDSRVKMQGSKKGNEPQKQQPLQQRKAARGQTMEKGGELDRGAKAPEVEERDPDMESAEEDAPKDEMDDGGNKAKDDAGVVDKDSFGWKKGDARKALERIAAAGQQQRAGEQQETKKKPRRSRKGKLAGPGVDRIVPQVDPKDGARSTKRIDRPGEPSA